MLRRAATLAAASLALTAAGFAVTTPAQATSSAEPPVVAVVDTGARATHQEFDYRGASSTDDQFVGWWDFTSERKGSIQLPGAGQTWDTAVADPYDNNGHGTQTAAMAGGRGASPVKTPSANPGGKLAIAKVGTGGGTIEGDIGAAVRWATDSVRADVINISIGSIVPLPSFLVSDALQAIAYARSKGVLVVVSNGNGYANAGVPGDPGWASFYAGSPNVLAVGAAGVDGLLVSTDPEVAAVFTVTGPTHTSDTGYASISGTSFASPYTAGFASALIGVARAAGRTLSVDTLERLVKYSAADTTVPPQFEGYGVVSGAVLAAAKAHAAAGTLPARPTPDVSGTYVESVAGTLRTAWALGS